MRVSLGISSSQIPSGAYVFPEVDVYQSDWTTLSSPAGWSEVGTIAGDYTADGVFASFVAPTFSDRFESEMPITPRSFKAATTIIAYKFFSTGAESSGSSTASDLFLPSQAPYQQLVEGSFGFVTAGVMEAWTPTSDLFIVATVNYENGNDTYYFLTSEGYTGTVTTTGSPRAVGTITGANLAIIPEIVEDSVSVTNTYIGVDEELTLSAIKTIATGWGWVENTFTPDGASTISSDWTTTALPADWNVGGGSAGTPVYNVSGTYNSSTTNPAYFYQDATAATYLNGVTFMAQVDVSSLEDHYYTFGFGGGSPAYIDHLIDTGTVTVSYFDNDNYNNFTPVSATGSHFISVSIAANGAYTAYFHESGETTQTATGTCGPMAAFPKINHVILNLEETGTPGSCFVVNTAVRLNNNLSQGAIETILSGWGWTP